MDVLIHERLSTEPPTPTDATDMAVTALCRGEQSGDDAREFSSSVEAVEARSHYRF